MGAFAWVTLATNDSYSLGALVLAHSLKQAGTAHQLAVLVTPGVTSAMREKLGSVFSVVQEVNILDSRDEANLKLLKRPELGITFTKLHCWRLTQFEKCVFLDADTLVLQNADELFEREELSAAPDVGWPDCFNSGVFVYRPSLDTYDKLIQFALEKGSFDGGDQGLLNLYFSDWAHKDISKHLPFIYNMCSTACYSYLPAFKQFGANAKIVHFIGAQKPWLQYFNTETKRVQPSGDSSHLQEILQRWWDIFCSLIHPMLSPAMQGQSQHGMSPSYFPPQYDPPPNPTASADDYENAWDPWDEYDQKIAQNTHYISVPYHFVQSQPIQSLNTNTVRVADQPTIHSQPQSQNYNTYSAQNNSYYQPPPPSPQVVYHHIPRVPTPPPSPKHHQPTQFHHHEPPQHHHPEPPQHHHYEHQSHYQPEPEQPQHHHIHTPESFPSERPVSPSAQVPILPKECESTTTVSNDMSLTSTIEDSNNQEDAGLAGAFSQLTLGVARTVEQDALENVLRKQAWEVGNIDYLGKDSFANIWSKITETLSLSASAPAPAESQSQSAPQEEASPVQPQVDSSKIDTPVVPVESKKEIQSEPPQEPSSEVPAQVAPVESSITEPATEATKVVEEVVTTSEPKIEAAAAAQLESVVEPRKEPVAEPLITPQEPLVEVESKPVEPVIAEPPQQVPSESSQTPVAEIPKTDESPVVAQAPETPQPQPESVVASSPAAPATPVAATPQPQPESVVAPSPAAPATPVAATPQPQPESVVAPSPAAPATPAAETPQPQSESVVASSPAAPATPVAKAPQTQPESSAASGTPVAETPQPQPAAKSSSPQTKVTEATPPVTPGTPPIEKTKQVLAAQATPPVTPGTPPIEKTKQALAAEASIPATPPPSEGGSTPTPPPRKTDKPKKVAAKSKK